MTTTTEEENTMNDLETITTKLQSMLAMTYGHAGASFRGMTDEMQDAFMHQAADLAAEAATLARQQ